MELQDDSVMLGLDSSLGKDIVGIINNVFQAPWGGSHTCQKDEKALECSLCQSSILCFQLGCELLERLTPREEIRLVVRNAPPVLIACEPCMLYVKRQVFLFGKGLQTVRNTNHWNTSVLKLPVAAKLHR